MDPTTIPVRGDLTGEERREFIHEFVLAFLRDLPEPEAPEYDVKPEVSRELVRLFGLRRT